ncbi:hypothetical protein EMIHUDRAFT_120394 [Emiliania huxleyi CCMP1516]|uniref:Uncharacterized protein n=2 Tax=Emiliania huxleyi TaxID=2903 RepID=A0A0D3IJ01_EMIH1|nr:hypothetical protein EMIHUDRAFT_120394 [Emiliania huxleyi CCMP1516]EOD11236.1 hypothetical protein EMIHUDRAFT_120394 [Emiliania huxleyi CCMP1516]|eukprot:XP_005763665.1 hypothetical protein EMIHUDRAFT_120394 [Emiliania huxleyi CCMP1516]
MMRLILALAFSAGAVNGTGDEAFEWAGTFDVADMNTVFWSAQSDAEGHYPDASMTIVIMQGNADNSLTEALELAGEESLEGACTELQPGNALPISSTGTPLPCYKLMFPCTMEGSGDDAECHADAHTAIWEIDTTGYNNIAMHYLKGPGGEDIEPIAEHPESTRSKRWGAAIGAAFIVMVCTLMGVVFLAPVFAKLQSEHESLVTVLASAFAAGALLAAAFYLMLYEATHLIAITDDRTEAEASAWWGSATLLGFVSPFLLESTISFIVGKAKPEERKDPEAANESPTPSRSRKVRVLSGVLLGDFLHNLVDGFFIGAAFANCDTSMAWTITAATVYHELAQEISDYLVLTNKDQGDLKPFMALGLNFLSGMSVLFGVCIVLSAEPSNFSTGCLLAYGAGVYLQIAATECMPRVHEFATTLNLRLSGFLLFVIGATAIGLVLLDHEHCGGEGGGDGHGH